jgi:hypothetical protein
MAAWEPATVFRPASPSDASRGVSGTLLYLLATGFCWARFVALALEVIGPATRDASCCYGVLTAAGTIPVTCMIWLDGTGFRAWGVQGLLWTDAVPNLLVFLLVTMLLRFRRQPR